MTCVWSRPLRLILKREGSPCRCILFIVIAVCSFTQERCSSLFVVVVTVLVSIEDITLAKNE
jgi:hypothetical protein